MRKKIYNTLNNYKYLLFSIIGGLLLGLSFKFTLFYLAWLSLIPLFLILESNTYKNSVKYLILMSFIEGGIVFSWMFDKAQQYIGNDTYIGILLIIIFSINISVSLLLYSFIYTKIIKKRHYTFLKIISAAALWVVIEWINYQIFIGLPFFLFCFANTQSPNLFFIQTASWGGMWSISLFVLLINYLLAISIVRKKNKPILIGLLLIVSIHIYGFVVIEITEQNTSKSNIKVAIITENIKPEQRWTANTGDSIEKIFYDLNKKVVKEKPNLIIWSESAVPWAFDNENKFLLNILNITYPAQAFHLMGIAIPNTNDTTKVTNSALFIAPDGAIQARYDKQELLRGLERPVFKTALKLPFISESIKNNVYSGNDNKPLNTPLGKIGVIICNESLNPYNAKRITNNGASFFTLLSNDSWFDKDEQVYQHLYMSRLRAVENRRCLIINSNMGYSGKISSSGRIKTMKKAKSPIILIENIEKNHKQTFYTKKGDLIIFLFSLFLFIYFIYKFINPKHYEN